MLKLALCVLFVLKCKHALFALNMNNYIVKWRLGAWSIQELPLLTASLQIEECLYGWHNSGTQS